MPRRIVVFGSLNMDLIMPADRLPRPGETLACGDFVAAPGGKGANQACAAGKLGVRVMMVGRIGDDSFGPKLIESLNSAAVDTSEVGVVEGSTGAAFILVLPDGENLILLSPGANARFDVEPGLFDRLALTPGDCALTQLESPIETVSAALAEGRRAGAMTILDPAPARALTPELLANVDWLTPNQTEAAILLGEPDLNIDDYTSAAAAARRLLVLGPNGVIMKLGALGCLAVTPYSVVRQPAFPVRALDTTAAGDAFNGAFAVALVEGLDLPAALRFGCAAAGISVTRMGAQPSMPSRDEVGRLLASAEAGCS
jgi:ribokinase